MKKFINPVSIVVLTCILTVVYCMSCSASVVDDMQESINKSEAYLDSLDARMPFMDTVGEGDDYYYLCEAYEEFKDAKADLDETRATRAYSKYNKYWKKCVEQALQVELSIKQRRAD